MNAFFSANEVHLEERVLIDAAKGSESQAVATLGVDNLLYTLDVSTGVESKHPIDSPDPFQAMALHRSCSHVLIGKVTLNQATRRERWCSSTWPTTACLQC